MTLVDIVCAGCGVPFTAEAWRRQRFCSRSCGQRGVLNARFNGGLCFNKVQRRWVIYCRDGSLMLYSRAVVAARLRRLLTSNEIVHHVNEDTTDDRDENLQVTTRSEHMRHHAPQLLAGRGA